MVAFACANLGKKDVHQLVWGSSHHTNLLPSCCARWGSNVAGVPGDCSVKLDSTPCYGVDCGYYGTCDAAGASSGGKKCDCLEGYTGDTCTIPPASSPCFGVNCNSRGICKNGLCECQNGFTGCNCEIAPNCTLINNANYIGNDLPTNNAVSGTSASDCCQKCLARTDGCAAFTFSGGTCYLKSSTNQGWATATGQTAGALPTTVTLAPDSCLGKHSHCCLEEFQKKKAN